jgi:hypothetical protein
MRTKAGANVVLCAGLLAAGCGKDGVRGPRPDEIPPQIAIPANEMTTGVRVGELSAARSLPSFRISQMPIRVRDYRACVDAGACSVPELRTKACVRTDGPLALRSTYGAESGDELPVTCLTPAQAKKYCEWHGARLPSPDELLLAARGRERRRYAWGDADPDCRQHPGGAKTGDTSHPCCGGACSEAQSLRTGTHRAGGTERRRGRSSHARRAAQRVPNLHLCCLCRERGGVPGDRPAAGRPRLIHVVAVGQHGRHDPRCPHVRFPLRLE